MCLGLALLGLGGLALLAACASAPYAEGNVAQLFPQGPRPRELEVAAGDRSLHLVQQDGGPARVLFIHGTPGDWQGWAGFLRDPRLRRQASLLAVDRPGWGAPGSGKVVPDLEQQAALLRPLLDQSSQPTLLVAHSYGGAVAARLALDDPYKVRGLVLIAPTLAPQYEALPWYEVPAGYFPVRLFLSAGLWRAYRELAPLRRQLKAMLPQWPNLRVPVALIQGLDDDQVDPRTADFAEAHLPAGLLRVRRVAGAGHWILWQQPRIIVDAILAMLRQTRSS